MLEFEWDNEKAARNVRKHGIAFVDAKSAFHDLFAVYSEDRSLNYDEQRMRVIAMVNGFVFSVSYTERGERIRLISARKATRHEQKIYDRHRRG